MSAANEAYERLMAARRFVSPEELEETAKDRARDELRSKIHRRLPKVY